MPRHAGSGANLGTLLANLLGPRGGAGTPSTLGQVLAGQTPLSTGGIVPPGSVATKPTTAITSTTSPAQAQAVLGGGGQVGPLQPAPAPRVNPSTGVPQAPAGAGFFDRLKFNFQNDPALSKALQAGSLRLLGGGSKSFARNVSTAGLAGLQALENQRGIQREVVEKKGADKRAGRLLDIQKGTLEETKAQNRQTAKDKAADRAVRAGLDTQRTKALDRQADAAFKRAEAALKQASKKATSPQLELINIMAEDLFKGGKTDPNTGKAFASPEAARAEAIRQQGKVSRREFVIQALDAVKANEPGGVIDEATEDAVIAQANSIYTKVFGEEEKQQEVVGLGAGTLALAGLGEAADGVLGSDGQVWKIVNFENNGQTAVLQNADGQVEKKPVAEIQAKLNPQGAAPPPEAAPPAETAFDREQRIKTGSAEQIGRGISPITGLIGKLLSQPREEDF